MNANGSAAGAAPVKMKFQPPVQLQHSSDFYVSREAVSPRTTESDVTAAGPMMTLKVSMPGKFSHLPLNKPDAEALKSGSVTSIQQLISKVAQKTDGANYKCEANIDSMKTHRDHSPPQEMLGVTQLLGGPILPASVQGRGGDRRDQYGTIRL